jgi:hypothetical protein
MENPPVIKTGGGCLAAAVARREFYWQKIILRRMPPCVKMLSSYYFSISASAITGTAFALFPSYLLSEAIFKFDAPEPPLVRGVIILSNSSSVGADFSQRPRTALSDKVRQHPSGAACLKEKIALQSGTALRPLDKN